MCWLALGSGKPECTIERESWHYVLSTMVTHVPYPSDMHIAAMSSCFASLLSTFLLFWAFVFYAGRFTSLSSVFLLCRAFFYSSELLCSADKKSAQQSGKKIIGRDEKVHASEEKCTVEKINARQSGKTTRMKRKMYCKEEKLLDTERKCSAQKKNYSQSGSVHIRGALYLWATVRAFNRALAGFSLGDYNM